MMWLAKVEEIVLPPVRATHHPWLRDAVLALVGAAIVIAAAVLLLLALRARRKGRDEV